MFRKDVFETVPRERPTAGVEEELGACRVASQGEPRAQRRCRRFPQRQDALSAPFTPHVDGGPRLEDHLVESQADELGGSKSGSKREVEHAAIAHAIASAWVGRVEDSLHLVPRKVGDEFLVGCLRWDGEQTVDLLEARGHRVLDESGEGLMAASRALRERGELRRVDSRSSRKASTRGTSKCSSINAEGRV